MRTPSRITLAAIALFVPSTVFAPFTAFAADLDYEFLRGPDYDAPAPVVALDWSGIYFGGHAGYSTTNFNFGGAGRSDVAHILRNTAVETQYQVSTWNKLPSRRDHDVSFGGFAGWNTQFDEVVLGIEADFTSSNQKARAADSISRFQTMSSGFFNDTTVATTARATLEDYGTIRGRAGIAYGQFLPFVTAGLAYGRALVGSSVTVTSTDYTDVTRATPLGSINQSGGGLKEKFALGGAVGAGIDVSITQNVFLRAEYQYVWFDSFGDNKMNVNTVRGAVGVKF